MPNRTSARPGAPTPGEQAASPSETQARPPEEFAAELRRLELELGRAASADDNNARLGLFAAPLGVPSPAGAGAPLAWRALERFPAASTIKVYVLQALLERVAAGRLALSDERAVGAADMVTGSGVLKVLSPGRSYPLLDLATLMIVVSDNTATNVLVDALGVDAINAVTQERGWHGTHLGGKLQQAPSLGAAKRAPSVTTPADLADYFGRLWRGELLPPELTEAAKAIYRQQQLSELGRALDYDAYSAEIGVAPWRIASKSGSVRGVRNDAGVFEPQRGGEPFVIAVMTRGCPDERFHAENLGARVVGQVAALVQARLGS